MSGGAEEEEEGVNQLQIGENQKTQESFISQSHITSSQRNQPHRHHSQKKTAMNNYGGQPTPRDITPNGVSRHNRITETSKGDSTPISYPPKEYGSNPFQAKPSDPSTMNTEDPCYFQNNQTELQKFLDARRSDIEKREKQYLRQNDDEIQSKCQLSVIGYQQRVLKSSLSQKSFVTTHTKNSSCSRKPIDRDQASHRVKSRSKKDQSYTTTDGRVHHPKIWGARQCSWKPHQLESLTSLIDQAMKNNIANKNAAVVSAQNGNHSRSYTPTSIEARSANNRQAGTGYYGSNSSSKQRAKSKPRFVTNCDWVKGSEEEEKQKLKHENQINNTGANGDSPMGDYFNKERAQTPNMGTRAILSVASPVKEAEEDFEEEIEDKLRRSGHFSNSSSSMLNFKKSPRKIIKKMRDTEIKLMPYSPSARNQDDEDEDQFQEEVGNLEQRSDKHKFARNYARQTSWRTGEVQAIQGLLVKAAVSKSQKSFKKCPQINTHHANVHHNDLRSKTPNNVTKIVINPCDGESEQTKCHGEFFSPQMNEKTSKMEPKSAGAVKYQLHPVEINPVVSAKDARTTPTRERNPKINSFIHYPKNSISSSKLSIESQNTSIQNHHYNHHNTSMRSNCNAIPPRYQQPTRHSKKCVTAVNRTNDDITSMNSNLTNNKRTKSRKYSNVQSKVKQIIDGGGPRGSSSCRISNVKTDLNNNNIRSKTPVTMGMNSSRKDHHHQNDKSMRLPPRVVRESKQRYSNQNNANRVIQSNERSQQQINYKSIIDENSNASEAARKIGEIRNSHQSEQIKMCYDLKRQLQRLDKEYVKQKISNEDQWISKQLLKTKKEKRAPFSEVV